VKTCDGYIRVSTKAAAETVSSPDDQRETIERIAAAKGVELAEIVDEMDGSREKRVGESAGMFRAKEARS
jgi:DNA invertase Pin-like site-specific DNA recombinase